MEKAQEEKKKRNKEKEHPVLPFKHGHGLSSAPPIRKWNSGTSPVVQWLRLCTPNAGDLGSILVRELDSTCHN